ncbi:MAG: GNAT family N-acetyltransferase [Clostridia bacterium]|nr:GNAT family N-acetyltransferase [Clostridia bacterium]
MTKMLKSGIDEFELRYATREDTSLILEYIKKLAVYEKMENQVLADEKMLEDSLFNRKKAEVLLAYYMKKPVGFMLFFHNFSTFEGKPGIYLEDLFIDEDMRKNGFGKEMLSCLARIAVERDCKRLEWACLDWNSPSIKFYKSLGAVAMDEWTVYRMTGQSLLKLADG